jgi:hypothetical protein
MIGWYLCCLPFVQKEESLAVKLSAGQSVQGFTVSGTYYVPEQSWSGKTVQREQRYTFYVMPTISHPPFMIALPDIQNEGVSRVRLLNDEV